MKNNAIAIISANYDAPGFYELTQNRPVATVPFGARYRMIDFALSSLVNSGVSSIGILSPYYYRSLLDHVGDGQPWGLAKKKGGLFILPGTAYGERNKTGRYLIRDFKRNRVFLERGNADYVILTDCSIVANIDFMPLVEQHIASGAPVSMLYKIHHGRPRGTYLKIKPSGRLAQFRQPDEDSDFVFADCIIINREYLINLTEWYDAMDNMDLLSVFKKNLSSFDINTIEIPGYVGFVDNIQDFMKVNTDMLIPEIRAEIFETDRQIISKIPDEPPTLYKSGADVKSSLVAAGCIIEGTVENSIISRSCRIEKGAVVKDAVLMPHCVVQEGAILYKTVLDKYVTVEAGTRLEGTDSRPVIIGKERHF